VPDDVSLVISNLSLGCEACRCSARWSRLPWHEAPTDGLTQFRTCRLCSPHRALRAADGFRGCCRLHLVPRRPTSVDNSVLFPQAGYSFEAQPSITQNHQTSNEESFVFLRICLVLSLTREAHRSSPPTGVSHHRILKNCSLHSKQRYRWLLRMSSVETNTNSKLILAQLCKT
jgi:hypothetical protein